eukprot:Blabericola_migrator_1__10318@NODE_57_length_15939_cov_84_297253_g52_i0_p1_GENE_NODE_57_length_15939_cov_84_297253_g52_i0NODE_57_length_15939_cov_84_297253_g52_i0_p1_ORF_typecomplete_len2596_score525_29EFhand_7/PF13499_6/0_0046EFhand_7/PF13499_6/0_029EFhand_8/PF13833_6/0_12EFhand_8/PF13833_6/8_4e03EFhand_8/PF13833_6/9_1e03EFhand_8/PF13833_6/0_0031EFhand_1/PF00036_32/0_011EFhand_1/PF00036_32/0_25EFhand_6/PF13405_6/0_0034EFhand_6/PF13405_6/16SPARC_Ca_bdg/PF10591_9/0_49SPARC_Ca_bdg/PF10591_9/1_8EFh
MRWNYSVPLETVRIAITVVPAPSSPVSEMPSATPDSTRGEENGNSSDDEKAETTRLLENDKECEAMDPEAAVPQGNIVIYLPLTAIKVSRLLGVKQRELFLPLAHPGKAPIDTLQPYHLHSNQQYRLRIIGLSDSGRETAASGWTHVIQPGGQKSFVDFPLIVLRKLFPSVGGSLALFIHKHCNVSPAFNIHVIASDYELEIYDERPINESQGQIVSGLRSLDVGTELTPLLEAERSEALTVDLELRLFYGYAGDERKARLQTTKFGRSIWHSVRFRGQPQLTRREEAHDVYALKCTTGQADLFTQDRLSLDQVYCEIVDVVSGHTIASGGSALIQDADLFNTVGRAVDNTRPEDWKFGICWKPRWHQKLYRGRSSLTPWGSVEICLHNVTSASFARHDMTPRGLLPSGEGVLRFTNDVPGAAYPQGSDMVVSWEWDTPGAIKPEHIYLHIHDHETNTYIATLQGGRPVPNTGSFCWAVDVPFPAVSRVDGVLQETQALTCYFTMSVAPYSVDRIVDILAQSNGFFVLRVLTLSHFELAYAAFCRTHNLEMEHVSEAALEQLGVDVHTMSLKVCPDLREPLSFEPVKTSMIHCPGQCIISTTSRVVALKDDLREVANHVNQKVSTSEGIHVYKSVSLRIPFLENLSFDPDPFWWTSSSDIFFIKHGLLDSRVFIAIDKFINLIRHNYWTNEILHSCTGFSRHIKAISTKGAAPAELDIASLPYLVPQSRFVFVSRKIIYQIFPTLLHLIVSMYQIWYFCTWPLTCLVLFGFYNYLEQDVRQARHLSTSSTFFSDIVFDPSISFVLSVPFPGPSLIMGVILWSVFMTVAIFLDPVTRVQSNWLSKSMDFIASSLQSLHIYSVYVLVTTFILWFFLGALINSDSFLPYAVMTGCVTFVTYTLWCNFLQAKEAVLTYIEKNQQTVLSVSFDKWFEHHHINFDYRSYFSEISHSAATTSSLQAKQQMRDELKALKQTKMRELHLFNVQEEEIRAPKASVSPSQERLDSSLTSGISWSPRAADTSDTPVNKRPGVLQMKTVRLREQLCFWVFDKIQVGHKDNFYFSFDENKQPMGLENYPGLPRGIRFATLEEALDGSNRIEELLIGFDVAMLHDGVQYGPRFGYKIDRSPNPSQKFTTAIVACPRYPDVDELEDQIKIALIFDYFDVDEDGYLSSSEFESWVKTCDKTQRICKKPELVSQMDESRRGTNVLESFRKMLSAMSKRPSAINTASFSSDTSSSHTTGALQSQQVTLNEIERYYNFVLEDLDRDYLMLFPTTRSDDNGSYVHRRLEYTKSRMGLSPDDDDQQRPVMWMDDMTEGSWSGSDDDDSEARSRSDRSDGGDPDMDHDFGARAQIDDDAAEDDKVDDVKSSAKLMEQVLEERVKEQLRSNINGLKLQYIFKHLTKECRGTQIEAITRSIPFIAQNVLDCHIALLSPSFGPDFLLPGRKKRRHSLESPSMSDADLDQLTLDMKLIHLELIKDFKSAYTRVYNDMFAATKGIANFYDHVIASKIQIKAARLTNSRVEISAAELDPSNRWAVTSPRPVCAFQAMRKFAAFRSKRIAKVREILGLAASAGQHQGEVQISLVTYALVESGMLRPAEIMRKKVMLRLNSGEVREVELMTPRSVHCSRFLQKMIHRMHIEDMMTVTELASLVKTLMSEYLWFAEFRLLINLLGTDLREDELPGRVWIDDIELHDRIALEEFQLLVRDQLVITQNIPQVKTKKAQQTEQTMRERRNLFKIKKIFDQLSNGSLFLPVDLADEGVLLLTDNRMGFSAIIAALKHLEIGTLNMASSRNLSDTLIQLGVLPQSPVTVVEIQSGVDRGAATTAPAMSDTEFLALFGVSAAGDNVKKGHELEKWDVSVSAEFDWTRLGRNAGWPENLVRAFEDLSAASPGFMGKSQMSEFIEKVKQFFEGHVDTAASLESVGTISDQGSDIQRFTANTEAQGLISFEMFAAATLSLGLSVSRHHARLLWCLICSELTPILPQLDWWDSGSLHSDLVPARLTKKDRRITLPALPLTHKDSVTGVVEDDLLLEILPVHLVAHSLARILLQPVDGDGHVLSMVQLYSRDRGPHDEAQNSPIPIDIPFSLIKGYEGYCTFRLFKSLIWKIGIDISPQGVKNLWRDLPKDPFEITHFLAPSFFKKKAWNSEEVSHMVSEAEDGSKPSTHDGTLTHSTTDQQTPAHMHLEHSRAIGSRYLRVGMDSTGMDPTIGTHIHIGRMKRQLPKLLMTGLWPAATKLLLQLYLQVNDFDEDRFDRVLERLGRDRSVMNSYGMVRPEALPTVLTSLNFEGMSFQMLKDLVANMRLSLPDRDIKRMFDMMDINHDHSLDLIELLSGFEILLSKLLPSSLLIEVGLSTQGLLRQIALTAGSLLIFFLFTALSFTSFVAVSTGASTAVQSLLALLGAVGLQSGATQDAAKVEEKMRQKLEAVIGGEATIGQAGRFLEEKMKENKEIMESIARRIHFEAGQKAKHNEMKPVSLRFVIPKKFMPDPQDPRPCLLLRPGDKIRLEPIVLLASGAKVLCPATVSGGAVKDISVDEALSWLRKGTGRVRSCDVMLQWFISPPLPHGLGLHMDPRTGKASPHNDKFSQGSSLAV